MQLLLRTCLHIITSRSNVSGVTGAIGNKHDRGNHFESFKSSNPSVIYYLSLKGKYSWDSWNENNEEKVQLGPILDLKGKYKRSLFEFKA